MHKNNHLNLIPERMENYDKSKQSKYCDKCEKITPGVFRCDKCNTKKPGENFNKK